MSSLLSFFESDFNTQRDQWENALKAELKLTEIGSKGVKKLLTGATWPTLSLSSNAIHLGVQEKWKKASTTYTQFQTQKIADALNEDLKMGVRNFFFQHEALGVDGWKVVEETLKKFSKPEELEVMVLGCPKNHYQSTHFKIITHLVSGELAHDYGGHSVQELALLATNLIHEIAGSTTTMFHIGVFLDSHFFQNIAKVRAAKLLAHKIIEETGGDREFKIVGLTSYRDWTAFERYSNMLRNEAAVASGYIAGADYVQSSGYNTIIEMEAERLISDEHTERSQRMARNTSHILALESMLGVVEDAAFGSYHLESLTQNLAEEAWKLMQTYVNLKGDDLRMQIEKDTSVIREKRLDLIKTRRHVMSGMNDYPDRKETLGVKLKPTKLFRLGRLYEELRLQMEALASKPKVYVALFGDYGALNGRLNFVKNYFELLGLEVHDPGHSETDLENFKKNLFSRKEEIVVFCAMDDQYGIISEMAQSLVKDKYIAGKTEISGLKNLFAGQNVYEVLHNLVGTYAGGK